MTDKHFNAILAKNAIAKELGDTPIGNMEAEDASMVRSSLVFISAQLQQIEDYIGQGNQPSIKDIIED